MQIYSCSSSLETSRIPLVFSSRSPCAYRNEFLKKLDLSFSLLFLRLLMRSAVRRLARRLLISSQRAFRPSFSDSSAFLQRLRSCLLLATRSSISFSLLPFYFTTASLMVTSPYLFLHSSYRISPNRFSLATTDPRRAFCSSPLRCSSNFLHFSTSLGLWPLYLVSLEWVLQVPGPLARLRS